MADANNGKDQAVQTQPTNTDVLTDFIRYINENFPDLKKKEFAALLLNIQDFYKDDSSFANAIASNRNAINKALVDLFDSKEAEEKIERLVTLVHVGPFITEVVRVLYQSPRKWSHILKSIEQILYNVKPKPDLNKALAGCSLNQGDIKRLSTLTDTYILPTEGDAKMCGFIYWVEEGRKTPDSVNDTEHGVQKNLAKLERDSVHKWMKRNRYVVKEKSDWEGKNLKGQLMDDLEEIRQICSVVVVFVMAHGVEDHVIGVDDVPVPLDDIDRIIKEKIPEKIPKVVVTQACQTSKKDSNITVVHSQARPTCSTSIFSMTQEQNKNFTSVKVQNTHLTLPNMQEGLEKGSSVPQEIPEENVTSCVQQSQIGWLYSNESSQDTIGNQQNISLTAVTPYMEDGSQKLNMLKKNQQESPSSKDCNEYLALFFKFLNKKFNATNLNTSGNELPVNEPPQGNFARLMVAASGESAQRNIFIPLLIEQLNDGKEFYAAFRYAADVTREEHEASTPNLTDHTLYKKLYLSKAIRSG